MSITEIRRAIKNLPQTTFGISVPELRKLARGIARTDYKYFVENNPNDIFELQLLHAFVIGYAKDDICTLAGLFISPSNPKVQVKSIASGGILPFVGEFFLLLAFPTLWVTWVSLRSFKLRDVTSRVTCIYARSLLYLRTNYATI